MTRAGFTLAEVLITLGVIGIVAALTMPALISNTQEKITVVKLKKIYSVLDNAMRMAVIEHGTADNWGLSYGDANNVLEKLSPYLNINENCGTSEAACGFYEGTYKSLSGVSGQFTGNFAVGFGKIRLNDGIPVAVWAQPAGDSYGVLVVDINGAQKPNVSGKDAFWFYIAKDRISPTGDSVIHSFDSACINSNDFDAGRGCTAWVIQNENMDYLHCDGLDWNTKTKCN
jgi:prepilin-type N-terminal cleavage/methylation domain-containing protein